MPKLTKTEIKLLQKAAKNPVGRVSVEAGVYRAYHGWKHHKVGERAYNAANKLLGKGLATRVSYDHYNNFSGTITNTLVIEITDEGRKALAALNQSPANAGGR